MIGLFTDSYEDSIANIASKIVISLIEASIVLYFPFFKPLNLL
jgi:hypothetical protein